MVIFFGGVSISLVLVGLYMIFGETNYNGWFPWGSPADLYFKKYDIK